MSDIRLLHVLEIACHVLVTTVPMTNNCMSQICDICPICVKVPLFKGESLEWQLSWSCFETAINANFFLGDIQKAPCVVS